MQSFHSIFLTLTAWLILLLPQGIQAMTTQMARSSANLEVQHSDPERAGAILRYAAECELLLTHVLQLQDPPNTPLILDYQSPADDNLSLSEKDSFLLFTWKICHILAQRRMKEIFPEANKAEKEPDTLLFLSAGIAYLATSQHPSPVQGNYSFLPLQRQYATGNIPNPAQLMAHPISPLDSLPLFQVYAMHSALLLKEWMPFLIQPSQDDETKAEETKFPLRTILELELKGRTPEEAVGFVLFLTRFPEEKTFFQWYRQTMMRQALLQPNLSLKDFLSLLKKILQIPIHGKIIPPEQYAQALQKKELTSADMIEKQQQLLLLRQCALPLLQDALNEMAAALSLLTGQPPAASPRRYQAAWNQAVRHLQEALQRQETIHAALLQWEQRYAPLHSYINFAPILDVWEKKKAEFFPLSLPEIPR